ncbi:MAG: hypothetical protein ABSH25_06245 [Syntrophorhabdales bacterium]|jgi:hypothetical protein
MKKGWKVRLDRYRATWTWFTSNPHGGGFGSNYCGPQYVAVGFAVSNIPKGEEYRLVINGKDRGTFVKA